MTETDSQPIAENEQVKELLALLKDNNTPGYEEFSKLIEHVTGMEQRLLEATEELKAVRQEMQGLQNHSLKDALQKSYTAMEANISVMRHRLSELKGQIINGCRNILADFRECEFNMRSLVTNTGADSIAIMGKNHMWLSDTLFAYCSTADLHQMISTTEFIGARAFLFHTDRSEGGHLYGDVLMMDLDTLRQDIKRNILYPFGVNIERKDGSAATVSLKEWTEMELYEKDALKSWGFSYATNQVTEWQYHYSTMFRQWMDQAFRYMPQDLEERLNMQYMETAQNPDMDKYRIPQGTAKQMLLYDEAPVYRLLPSGSEKIAPIAAISTGLWYENYREFAIAPEDLGALDKLIRRETDRLTGNLPQLHKNEERRPAPER